MLKKIKSEKEYNDALAHIYKLMQKGVKEGSAESDDLEAVSIAVKEYELINYPMSIPLNT